MTKREAYDRIDKGDLTWGHLKHYIEQCVDHGWGATSAVNPSITRRQALDILYAAIAPNEDNELIVSPRYTQARNSRNSLMAVNVLRETHWRVSATNDPAVVAIGELAEHDLSTRANGSQPFCSDGRPPQET